MPRRSAAPRPPAPKFRYASVAECEDSGNDTHGYHQIRPSRWPPSKRGNPDGSMSVQCEHCNGWCIVYEDNDPEQSGVKIITPEPKKKAVPA